MQTDIAQRVSIVRQVFPSWSVHIPPAFEETFVEEDEYWHAWDAHRSVSLSGFVVDDARGPVSAQEIVDQLSPPEGARIDVLPRGLLGWAVEVEADPTAKASRALSGLLASEGRALLTTITSDDPAWRRATWLSIRHHEARRVVLAS